MKELLEKQINKNNELQ